MGSSSQIKADSKPQEEERKVRPDPVVKNIMMIEHFHKGVTGNDPQWQQKDRLQNIESNQRKKERNFKTELFRKKRADDQA